MATTITGLTFLDYKVTDDGVTLHFTISSGGSPGMQSEYYINLTDVEINSAANVNQINMIIQQKINRLFNAAGIASILDADIGTVFAPANPAGIPPYFSASVLGSSYVINPLSPCSIGTELAALGGAAPVSTAWGTANLSIAVPFIAAKPLDVSRLLVYNGATVSGNIDIGIYSDSTTAGNLIISAGSTVQAGVNAIQQINLTPNVM